MRWSEFIGLALAVAAIAGIGAVLYWIGLDDEDW